MARDPEKNRANVRAHYARNRDRVKARVKKNSTATRIKRGLQILAYLMEHPCVDCDEADPIVLEFDHKDRKTKKAPVSRLTHCSEALLFAEIAKCDVRCANCHTRRTAVQFGWKRAVKRI